MPCAGHPLFIFSLEAEQGRGVCRLRHWNTRRSPKAESMLGQRHRRWANIETTSGEVSCLFGYYSQQTWRSHKVGSMLAHHLRYWPSIEPAFGEFMLVMIHLKLFSFWNQPPVHKHLSGDTQMTDEELDHPKGAYYRANKSTDWTQIDLCVNSRLKFRNYSFTNMLSNLRFSESMYSCIGLRVILH